MSPPHDPADAGADVGQHVAEVRAAGGVVWRRGEHGLEVLIVHRPHRLDWSLPKGKVDPGETVEQTALRELLEETGLHCRLGASLGTVDYRDHKGRAKTVWYWVMHVEGGVETLNDEVDEMVWLPVTEAAAAVSYSSDALIIERFRALGDDPQ